VPNVYVKRFDGTNWVPFGTGAASGSGISGATGAGVIDLALTTDGTKVAAAWTVSVSGTRQVYLREYSGGTWNQLGGSASGSGISAAAGNKNTPTVAYLSGTLFAAWQNQVSATTEIYVARFNGSAWAEAGTGAAS